MELAGSIKQRKGAYNRASHDQVNQSSSTSQPGEGHVGLLDEERYEELIKLQVERFRPRLKTSLRVWNTITHTHTLIRPVKERITCMV